MSLRLLPASREPGFGDGLTRRFLVRLKRLGYRAQVVEKWCPRQAATGAFRADVTAFHFAVLLRAPRFDRAQPHPCLLDGERKGEREFGAIVDVQFPGNGSVVRSVVKNVWLVC